MDHGGWMPWLREHCALAERTARLYMQVARSGLKSATVADLGLQAAAKAIALQYPDPFDGTPPEELLEWHLFMLWQMRQGRRCENAGHHCEWLKRNCWASPSEWLGQVGDRLRKSWGMRPMPANLNANWFSFLAESCNRQVPAVWLSPPVLALGIRALSFKMPPASPDGPLH
jgi:hypothetical protein